MTQQGLSHARPGQASEGRGHSPMMLLTVSGAYGSWT